MKLLRESNTLFGFISSLSLSLIAIFLATIDNDYWVWVLVISQIILWSTVYKVDKFYKNKR